MYSTVKYGITIPNRWQLMFINEQYLKQSLMDFIHIILYTHSVPDLPVCDDERAVPQCCVVGFILERLNVTEEDFLEGLREQLRERFQSFEDITNRLRQCELHFSYGKQW